MYDEEYAREVRDTLDVFRAAGLRVEAGLGLNDAPPWLPDAFPSSVFVNQFGEQSTSAPNIVFSEPVREHIAAYVRAVDRLIGLDRFWAVRVGISETGEFAYPNPPETSSRSAEFWAYDRHAQEQSPYPGWRPGESTYHGRPFTREQVARWYDWYAGALAGAVNWQLDLYTSLGYEGALKVLIPGSGFYPSDLRAAVDARLVGSPPSSSSRAASGSSSRSPWWSTGTRYGSSPPPWWTAPAPPWTTAAHRPTRGRTSPPRTTRWCATGPRRAGWWRWPGARASPG